MKNIQVLTSRPKVPILTYKADVDTKHGDIVLVPFRNQHIMALVWEEEIQTKARDFNIKPVGYKFGLPAINKGFIKFINSFAKYYIIDLASCCKLVLPITLKPDFVCKTKTYELNIKLPELNSGQKEAFQEIKNSSQKVSLLEGVTGSGKTEVYFHLIEDCIKKNKQVLLMLPEIGLTTQLLERFTKTFGIKPAMWHSGVSITRKKEIFSSVVNGEEKVVIGTRSSLFLPYKNLGLIIVDEEHDGAYKQEENVLYNARDSAILRSSFEHIKVVLVSATPSIETYQNCKTGKYHHSILTNRFGIAKMPNVQIVDMKKQPKNRWISTPLEEAVKEGLAKGLQSILFINRRGYAPLMLCSSCGYRVACSSCSSWLVVHKKNNALICHHCGFSLPIPKICPECSNEAIIACGPGVERIAEEAEKLFPMARIHLFTKEEANSKDAINSFVKEIEKANFDIIIGTQIITKGYHFPLVSTVGIIDADLGAANIDLKANERCFQILQQVSGRAGRDEFEGTVYIQTYFPDNKIFEILSNNLSEEFYANEILNREKNFLPPFTRIIALIISGEEEIATMNFAKLIKNRAPKTSRVKLLGPAPATMSKLKGNFRFRILLVADKSFNLQLYITEWIKKCEFKPKTNIRIEVDPYSFY